MVTIYDIAQEVGCSSATVSKALNNYPDVNIKTKQTIQNVAREMGYIPNSQAQSLTKKKTWNIGLLFEVDSDDWGGFTHYFFADIIDSFKEYTEDLGYDLTYVSKKLGSDHVTFLQHVRRRHCDGVVIINYDYNNPEVLELVHSQVPVVVVDYNFEKVSSIISDNDKGMSMLTQYLIDLNHREIVYLHGQHNFVTDKRINAFKRTMNENGIETSEMNLIEGIYYDRQLVMNKTNEVLDRKNRPTAIIYSDDYAAVWGAKAIGNLGLRIPEDVSIAGYDGIELGEMMTPRLTTVVQDRDRIGVLAAQRLIDIIETKNHSKVDVYLGVSLEKGKSCMKLRNNDHKK